MTWQVVRPIDDEAGCELFAWSTRAVVALSSRPHLQLWDKHKIREAPIAAEPDGIAALSLQPAYRALRQKA